MRRRIDLTIEDSVLDEIDKKTTNRSAYIEMVVRQYLNSNIEQYECQKCMARFQSSFEPAKCLVCGKEALKKVI